MGLGRKAMLNDFLSGILEKNSDLLAKKKCVALNDEYEEEEIVGAEPSLQQEGKFVVLLNLLFLCKK